MPVVQPIGSFSMWRAVTPLIRSLFPFQQRRMMSRPEVPNTNITGFKSIVLKGSCRPKHIRTKSGS